MTNTLFLYTENIFDVSDPTSSQITQMQEDANTIRTSGFTDFILAFIHVNATGGLVYNSTQLNDLYSGLPEMLAGIKSGGSVQRLLVSIGGGGGVSDHDYPNIQANLPAFQNNLELFMLKYHIDGVDFDLEAVNTPYSNYTDLLIDLTAWLSDLGPIVTMPPYMDQDFWVQVLEGTNVEGVQQVSYVNLQASATGAYDQWLAACTKIGVSNLPGFLFPGYGTPGSGASVTSTPSEVQSAVQSLKAENPTLSGGMLWKYDPKIGGDSADPAAYAKAFKAGLG